VVDSLPKKLDIMLRANRHGATLPDNHGQIWQALYHLSKADTLFTGSTISIQRKMLNELGLGGTVKFPIRRLVTLWRNENWKDMITRWCETAVGRETFVISCWEDMVRCRVDDVSLFLLLFFFCTAHRTRVCVCVCVCVCGWLC
jgi:hypothetical protein